MIKLKCQKCGDDYDKPDEFKRWNDEKPNVFFKWRLTFCDSCRREKENEAIKKLPEILNALVNDA